MSNIYKKLLPLLIAVCVLQAQNPACAKGFKLPFFKKHKVKQEQTLPSDALDAIDSDENQAIYKDETPDTSDNTTSTDDGFFPDDENVTYIKSLEILGNNMVDVGFIQENITSKEGHVYDRKTITKDLNNLYATGYFTQNIRAVPIRLDDGNIPNYWVH